MIAIGSSDNLICSSIVWLLLRHALHHSSRGTSIVSLHFTPPVNKAGRAAVPAADHGLAAANTFRTWSNYDKPLASWQRLAYVFSWRSRLSEQRTTWHHVTLPNMSQQFWFIFVHCAQLARSSARVATPCWSTDDTLHSTHHKLRTSMVRMIDTSGSRKSTAQNEFGHLVSLLSKDPGLQQVQDTKKHIKFRLWRNQLC